MLRTIEMSWLLFAMSVPFQFLFAGNGVNYEEDPIRYSATKPVDNDIARLQGRLDSGSVQLRFDGAFGYLPAILEALEIPAESQALVFSKTSLQNDKIAPTTPRAIYFNDRVHLGYVQEGVIEIAAADSKLGMAFYTLRQESVEKPMLERQANRCMSCHGVARTRSVPGVLVRSIFPDGKGTPVVSAGSYQSTHRSPIAQRWGGWYVTGNHGKQSHLGNFILDQPKKPKAIDNQKGMNLETLQDRFDTAKYLRPNSDLVALMVLEHQVDAYNLLTQANFVAQHALFQMDQSVASGESKELALEKARERIADAVKPLVEYLFFDDEPPFAEPVRGDQEFVRAFTLAGKKDSLGSSLRDLDLQQRLFKNRLSYLIYSPVIEGFPLPLRQTLAAQIEEVLHSDMPHPKLRLTSEEKVQVDRLLKEVPPTWLSQLPR